MTHGKNMWATTSIQNYKTMSSPESTYMHVMADIVTNRAMNDDYKNMSTLNTYCGIMGTCHNYKNKSLSLIEFFVRIIIFNQVNQAR